ncbi:MAG: serine/threonine protein kinase, partial [Planctomycetes bacterium]|nr:serine/threonine protein kinase [Planctomycetota bacterium]
MTSSNRHHELIRRAQTQVNRLRSRLADASTTASSDTQSSSRATPPAPLGYRILREIHRGGQGIVYLAEQESTRRTVALKVMREGPLASEAERARFRQEVRLLAALRHPHIVTIHDSGESGGRFYYIMDYIEGLPLDAFVRVNRPAVNDALRLFVKIADAVNAAHLRGVIHRDLKPPNVRVDGDGNPHVLDFGLAKVIGEDFGSTGGTAALTRTGEFVGSLPWASPEQAEGRHDDVDLRTDVYALGLLLYQMLTGELPYGLSGSARQILDTIVTKPPIRPSELRPDIDADVETIVLKCLAKERERRYQTAGELAQDVNRYLKGLPIEARRDSMVYVLKKHAARHKLAVALSGALLTTVLAGAVGMFVLWLRAAQERDEAQRARQAATDQGEIADARAADAEAVTKFLQALLADADPSQHGGRELTVRAALDEAAELVDQGQFDGRPRVEAAVRSTLGTTYDALGAPTIAVRHFRRSVDLHESEFGPQHVGTAAALYDLGVLLVELGRSNEAESILRRALECFRRAHGGA